METLQEALLFILILIIMLVVIGLVAFLISLIVRLILNCWLPRTIERVVIGQITSVVRQNLPLATALALAANSERGLNRSYLRRIATLLAQGLPLYEAVRKSMPNCSALTLSLIFAGERTGQLALALEQAEANLVHAGRRGRTQVLAIPYAIAMLSLTGLVTSGIMVAVIPKFKDIFKDFDAQLPNTTLALISFCSWWVDGVPPGWTVALPVVLVGLYLWVRPRRWGEPRLTSRLADRLRWHLPVLRRIAFGRNMKAALETMRLGVCAGLDLVPAARLAGLTDLNVCLQRNINRFAQLLEAGTDVRKAARQARLGEIAGLALAAGQRTGDMDAALRYAVDYHDALAGRLLAVIRNLTVPLVVLCVGSFVGWVVLSLFLPLIALIDSVTRGVPQ